MSEPFSDGFFGTFLGVVDKMHKCLSVERTSHLNVKTEPKDKVG